MECGFEVDVCIEEELKKESGFCNVRRMKFVVIIGFVCCFFEYLEVLVFFGVNIVRFNMCYGIYEWYWQVIRNCCRLCFEKGYGIVVMIDIEGSEIYMGDFGVDYDSNVIVFFKM